MKTPKLNNLIHHYSLSLPRQAKDTTIPKLKSASKRYKIQLKNYSEQRNAISPIRSIFSKQIAQGGLSNNRKDQFSDQLQQLNCISSSLKRQLRDKCSNFMKGYVDKLKKQRKRLNKKKNQATPSNASNLRGVQEMKIIIFDRIVYKPFQTTFIENSRQKFLKNQINFSGARSRRLNNARYIQQLPIAKQAAFQQIYDQKNLYDIQFNQMRTRSFKRNSWTSRKIAKEKVIQPWQVQNNEQQSLFASQQF